MDTLYIEKLNNTYMRIKTSEDINEELSSHFTFLIPNHQHNPKVKARVWDGKIRLYSKAFNRLYLGLIGDVQKFCSDRGYNLVLSSEIKESFLDESVTKEYFSTFIKSLSMFDSFNQTKMQWRDYQLLALWKAAKHKRATIISATGTGKSAFIYGACRFYQEAQPNRILLVVPNTGLVEQMYSDFRSYAMEDEEWVLEENTERLYSGMSLSGKQILISTWQSLMNQTAEFFEQFGAVVIDEAHGAKAKEVSTILENCINAEYRIGTTGTLDGVECNELVIKGLLGPIVTVQTSRQGIDKGILAELDISCIELKYSPDVKKLVSKYKYNDEIEFLFNHEGRNSFITNLANKLEGNTLILFSRVDHGKELFKRITELVHDERKVFIVHGDVDPLERNDIRAIVEKEKDAIIVASYQTMSTGTNVRSIANVIFASPSKSTIRVLQSIGRGLRVTDEKTHCKLFDIYDNLTGKNHTFNHFIERVKIYSSQEFKYKVSEIIL